MLFEDYKVTDNTEHIIEELKEMFPNYHPEDYVYSVAPCCGSCKKGKNYTYCVVCYMHGVAIEMFPYGICPQYERDTDIKMPVVLQGARNPYGNGQD